MQENFKFRFCNYLPDYCCLTLARPKPSSTLLPREQSPHAACSSTWLSLTADVSKEDLDGSHMLFLLPALWFACRTPSWEELWGSSALGSPSISADTFS